jgi:hypothetical protein
MLATILNDCPAAPKDQDSPRFEWIWQRDYPSKISNKTMYWDCLFVARLYLNNPPPAKRLMDLDRIKLFDGQLSVIQKTYDLTVGQIDALLSQLKDLEKLARGQEDPVKFVKNELAKLSPAVKLKKIAVSLENSVTKLRKGNIGPGARQLMEAVPDPIGLKKKLRKLFPGRWRRVVPL